MAGLSPKWDSTGKRPTLSTGGQAVSLLDRLSRKEYLHPLLITDNPFLPEAEKALDETSATQSGDSSAPRAESEVKSTAPDTSDLSDTLPLVKSMKHILRNTPSRIGSQMGGSKRSLSGSGEVEPIDVESLPEKDFSRENRCVRRRMTSQPEKSASSQPSPSSPTSGSTQQVHAASDSDLHDCPIVNDSRLSGDAPPELSPSGSIVKFNPPSFGVPSGLIRTVDLPFDSAVEEKKKSSGTLSRPVDRTTGGKLSAHSAFRRQMFGDTPETKLPEVVEESKETTEAVPDPPVVSMEGKL